jgi:hypothetical protein
MLCRRPYASYSSGCLEDVFSETRMQQSASNALHAMYLSSEAPYKGSPRAQDIVAVDHQVRRETSQGWGGITLQAPGE